MNRLDFTIITTPTTIKKFVVQDTWDEEDDQELLKYLRSKGLLKVLPAESILQCIIESTTMIFADSSLIQCMLGPNLIIDTYPEALKSLFGRRIEIGELSRLNETKFPVFVKRVGSDKNFAARVVHTLDELKSYDWDSPLYLCEVVDFVSEHRLFLSTGKIWGSRDYSEWIIGHRMANTTNKDKLLRLESTTVPIEFSTLVLELCDSANLGFVVVDVGMTDDGNWCVVEVNPPFALSSYDLDIGIYVEYCCAAWLSLIINTHNNFKKEVK
jgi:hypothetical protein